MTHRMMSLIVLGVPLILGAPAIAQTVSGSATGEGDLGASAAVVPATPSAPLGISGGGSLASNIGTTGTLSGNLLASAMVVGNAAVNGSAAVGTEAGNASMNGQSCASANAAFGLSTADLTENAGDCTP